MPSRLALLPVCAESALKFQSRPAAVFFTALAERRGSPASDQAQLVGSPCLNAPMKARARRENADIVERLPAAEWSRRILRLF